MVCRVGGVFLCVWWWLLGRNMDVWGRGFMSCGCFVVCMDMDVRACMQESIYKQTYIRTEPDDKAKAKSPSGLVMMVEGLRSRGSWRRSCCGCFGTEGGVVGGWLVRCILYDIFYVCWWWALLGRCLYFYDRCIYLHINIPRIPTHLPEAPPSPGTPASRQRRRSTGTAAVTSRPPRGKTHRTPRAPPPRPP